MYGIIIRLFVAVPAGERIRFIVNIMEGVVAERAVHDGIVRVRMDCNVSWCAGGHIKPLRDCGKVLVLGGDSEVVFVGNRMAGDGRAIGIAVIQVSKFGVIYVSVAGSIGTGCGWCCPFYDIRVLSLHILSVALGTLYR